jgi:hypothetical protein
VSSHVCHHPLIIILLIHSLIDVLWREERIKKRERNEQRPKNHEQGDRTETEEQQSTHALLLPPSCIRSSALSCVSIFFSPSKEKKRARDHKKRRDSACFLVFFFSVSRFAACSCW